MVSLNQVTAWAMELNEVIQQPHFEKISFRIRKRIFATLDEKNKKLVVKLTEIDQSVFCTQHQIIQPIPGSWGKKGWTIVDLGKVDKRICLELLRTAYQTVSHG